MIYVILILILIIFSSVIFNKRYLNKVKLWKEQKAEEKKIFNTLSEASYLLNIDSHDNCPICREKLKNCIRGKNQRYKYLSYCPKGCIGIVDRFDRAKFTRYFFLFGNDAISIEHNAFLEVDLIRASFKADFKKLKSVHHTIEYYKKDNRYLAELLSGNKFDLKKVD